MAAYKFEIICENKEPSLFRQEKQCTKISIGDGSRTVVELTAHFRGLSVLFTELTNEVIISLIQYCKAP